MGQRVTVTTNKLVHQVYDINDFEIAKLAADKNPYWMKVHGFWWQVKEYDANRITPGQAKWLSDIEESLLLEYRPKWMEEEGTECFP